MNYSPGRATPKRPPIWTAAVDRALDIANDARVGAAVAVAIVAAAASARWMLLPELGTRAPFMTFYLAVALAAALGGFRAGLIATLLSAAFAAGFWLESAPAFVSPAPSDLLSLTMFVASGLVVSWTAERARKIHLKARRVEASRREEVERQARLRTLELEAEIAERRGLEERFRQVTEFAPTAMIMIDEAGLVELVNLRAEAVFGYPREELLGRPVDLLLPERFRRRHKDYRAAFLTAPKARAMGAGRNLFARRKNGEEFPIEAELSVLTSSQGVKIVASIVDISGRRETERALAERDAQIRLMLGGIRDSSRSSC